jgi:hypothetical protein
LLAQALPLDEAAGFVGADRALVLGADLEPDSAKVAQPEGVAEEQADRIAPLAAPPEVFAADGDAQLTVAGGLVYVEQTAVAYKVAVGLDREIRLVAPGGSAPPCRRTSAGVRGRSASAGRRPPASSTSTSFQKLSSRGRSSRVTARSVTF